jgi:hypothetical protein
LALPRHNPRGADRHPALGGAPQPQRGGFPAGSPRKASRADLRRRSDKRHRGARLTIDVPVVVLLPDASVVVGLRCRSDASVVVELRCLPDVWVQRNANGN